MYTWTRRGGYEVSSKGDKRFSALNAVLRDGRTIEMHYQLEPFPVGKGYQPGGRDWCLGKGKPPLDRKSTPENLYEGYLDLWRQWAQINGHLMLDLRIKAYDYNNVLSDIFATTPVNQARALSDLLNDGF